MTETQKAQLRALTALETSQQEDLSRTRQTIRKLQMEIVHADFGLGPEVLLRCRKGIYKFAEIDRLWELWETDKPWVLGYQKLKNGSFGVTKHRLYGSWEVVK